MIETIYQAPELPMKQPCTDDVMEAFKRTTMFATMYQAYEAPKDEEAIEEATEWLAIETTIEYTPYQSNLFNSDEIQMANEWIKEVSSPKKPEPVKKKKVMTEDQREKYLKYQREYYKKNAEKRKAEMRMNYYRNKILN